MTYAEFQERWEAGATAELARYAAMPVTELLTRIEARELGDYYMIWPALADRATLAEAGWILFRMLESDLDYFHRYHCAAALLRLAGIEDAHEEPAHYSAEEVHDVAANLRRLHDLIAQRIGDDTRP
jgi:hypothetical protein